MAGGWAAPHPKNYKPHLRMTPVAMGEVFRDTPADLVLVPGIPSGGTRTRTSLPEAAGCKSHPRGIPLEAAGGCFVVNTCNGSLESGTSEPSRQPSQPGLAPYPVATAADGLSGGGFMPLRCGFHALPDATLPVAGCCRIHAHCPAGERRARTTLSPDTGTGAVPLSCPEAKHNSVMNTHVILRTTGGLCCRHPWRPLVTTLQTGPVTPQQVVRVVDVGVCAHGGPAHAFINSFTKSLLSQN